MNKFVLRWILCVAVVGVFASTTLAQGRGRGNGNGRRYDVFGGRDYRGRNQDWKCGKFVNCHDARDGRIDGRGPRRNNGFWQNGSYYSRGSRVGYRRYNMNDYWRRRHLTYGNRYRRDWRYR